MVGISIINLNKSPPSQLFTIDGVIWRRELVSPPLFGKKLRVVKVRDGGKKRRRKES